MLSRNYWKLAKWLKRLNLDLWLSSGNLNRVKYRKLRISHLTVIFNRTVLILLKYNPNLSPIIHTEMFLQSTLISIQYMPYSKFQPNFVKVWIIWTLFPTKQTNLNKHCHLNLSHFYSTVLSIQAFKHMCTKSINKSTDLIFK